MRPSGIKVTKIHADTDREINLFGIAQGLESGYTIGEVELVNVSEDLDVGVECRPYLLATVH